MQRDPSFVRKIYLYLFSFVGLVVVVIGSVQLMDLGLRIYVFKDAESVIRYPMYPQKAIDGTQEPLTLEEQAMYDQEQMEAETKNRKAEHQRTLANSLAMIFVGTPLFLYHWRVISQENKD